MSNNHPSIDINRVRFDFALNLHYGALHLLWQVHQNLKDSGVLLSSESKRFESFSKFLVSVLERGHKRFNPGLYSDSKSKVDSHEN